MDREQIIKELTDPQAIRQQFFNLLREYTTHHKSQTEAALDGESPAYIEYLSTMRKLFGEVGWI